MLFFMSQRDIESFTLVEADDKGRDAAVTWHVIQRHDLEAGALGSGKCRDETVQIIRLANHGDGLGRGRLERQCRLPCFGRLTIERQPALVPLLVKELLDFGRRYPFAVFDQALDGTELLDQLDGRLFTDAADAWNIVRHVAYQAL